MAKKARALKVEPIPMAEYHLANPEKLNRAINGSVGAEGKITGGVGKNASEAQILAEYDRLGGLVLKRTIVPDVNDDGDEVEKVSYLKLATGTFWDFQNGRPKAEVKPKFVKEEQRGGVIVDEVSDEEPKKRGRKAKIQDE